MKLFTKRKGQRQDVRFGMQKIEDKQLICALHFARMVVLPENGGKMEVILVEKEEKIPCSGKIIQAPYYMQFWAEESRENCLNVGYAAGQTASYLKFCGIPAVILRTVPEELQEHSEKTEGMSCVAALAFGYREPGAKCRRYSEDSLCIRKEAGDKWSEEVLSLAARRRMAASEYTQVICKNGVVYFRLKSTAKKHPLCAAVDAGIVIADVMAAADELWIELEMRKQKEISEEGYLLSLCRKEEKNSQKQTGRIQYA